MLQQRPTDKNITKIKEELIELKKMNEGVQNSIISHSQLTKESQMMANKVVTGNRLV